MDSNKPILDSIDPDLTERLVSRRSALSTGLKAGLALGSIPVALAALSKNAYAQATLSVQQVIDFALMLEIFENEFYKAVLGTSAVAAQNTAFATVRAAAAAVPGAVVALQQIQKHEAAHVAFLTANGAVNSLGLTAASFDFTGARGAGNGPFAGATTDLNFLLLVAQGAEDTGVRAYKGQAGNLMSNTVVLEAALRIHSVEARHASKIRRMRRATGATGVKYSGTISGGNIAAAGAGNITSPPAAAVTALTAIYAGEENTTHGTINVTTLSNLPTGFDATAASEAFDEPLTKAQVVSIVQPFFLPTIP
jgi:hypothetical protein